MAVTISIACLAGLFAVSTAICAWLWHRTYKGLTACNLELARFSHIADAEQHKETCHAQALKAEQQRQEAEAMVHKLAAQKQALSSTIRGYQEVVGNFKSAQELKTHVGKLRELIGAFEDVKSLKDEVSILEQQLAHMRGHLATFKEAIEDAKTASEIKAKVVYFENLVAQLEDEVEQLSEAKELQEFAFYRPRFDLDHSDEYRRKLEANRAQQKQLLKADQAAYCATKWQVEGSRTKGDQMVKQAKTLMLRAFNGECDAAVAKATYRNVESLGKRIERAFEAINKQARVNQIEIVRPYLDLKLDELHLAYEWEVKKQEEKDEHDRIKEQMREEKKVTEEIEKAQKAAEKEEKERHKEIERNEAALMRARAELEEARKQLSQEGKELESLTADLQAKADRLQAEHEALVESLREATERKAKAIARAQLTRSGHVYILSNIGSFGDNCFKIGLSRRLEPLERVRELGSASVPFPFDVHAMIYSEDAPALENALHRHFNDRRINRINQRKEFFHVTLHEIIGAVEEYHGVVTFVLNAEASDYRQTVNLLREEGLQLSLPATRLPRLELHASQK
ncbi:MAG: DUF4041 domain-containing protein [Pirellulaceae bacterium]